MKLEASVKARITQRERDVLEAIVANRRSGTKLSDIVREAIGEYIDNRLKTPNELASVLRKIIEG